MKPVDSKGRYVITIIVQPRTEDDLQTEDDLNLLSELLVDFVDSIPARFKAEEATGWAIPAEPKDAA